MTIDQYTDQEIVDALLMRDPYVTREFLYKKCFPLFASIHNRYYTDCVSPIELLNSVYVDLLMPNPETGVCKLEKFGFRCSLTMWLKIVVENYCRQLYTKKIDYDNNFFTDSDRNADPELSLEVNFNSLDMQDALKILHAMPNERYRTLIRLRYIEDKTHEETALALGMTMDNYYNKHKLARAQLGKALIKEGII